MKKLLTVAAALCVVASVSAKKPMSEILPACGDYAIGVDMVPFLDYAGGIFSRNDATSPAFQSLDNFTIMGKYFVQPDRAIRAGVRLDLGVDNVNGSDLGNPAIDKEKTTDFGITLLGGYEWRRGYGRLQGFYGVEGNIFFSSETVKTEYLEALSSTNDNNGEARDLKRKSAPEFGIGAAGFLGVEYFFAPKMAIGGEFNLAFNVSISGKNKLDQEVWNVDRVDKTSTKGDSSTDFALRTNPTGRLYLMFHF